ncbi:efflux transporter outer membrane subunit [Pseudomonas sp. NPDC089554]|uniref:efflux transporter outer membrane subunit n=1 Tax=Pseudomonas sp. NPDC089554 TaxID=3390653 RepID=UPI003D074828
MKHLMLAGLALSLGACAMVGPDYEVPKDAAIQRGDLNGPLRQDADSVVSAPVPDDWWQLYQDQRLNALVRQALSANTELRVAAANIAKARAQVEVADAQGGFSGGAEVAAQRLQESGESFLLPNKVPVENIGEAILSASYQFDLWGTFKRGTEAAQANADAVQAAADTARITLVADVVKAYTQVCSANEEYHIAHESLDLQQQNMQLTQRLRDAGRGDDTHVSRSLTLVETLRAELPRFKAERETGLYTLAALLALPVEKLPVGTAECAELPHLAQLIPVGDGAALLKRRPDVRQAERQLAAATANIGVATGALYPNISFGAQVGTIGILDNLGEPATNRWGFGPLVSWTIPTNGTRARIRMAEASSQAALAHFDGVVLNAIRETQTRLAQYSALLERRDALAEAERSAKESAEHTHLRYQVGRESFLADLQATQTYTDVRAQLAAANSQVALGQVGVFLALGGGWK